jgi:hypothetical protein
MSTNINHSNTTPSEVGANGRILLSVLAALSEGRTGEATDRFDEQFSFSDHALGLEFSDKGRLSEFFQKSRELFPDSVVEADAIFECKDRTVVQWTLKATQDVSYGGYFHRRVSILLRGVSIVHIKSGRVTRWSDYYDQMASRRSGLASFLQSGLSTSRSPPQVHPERLISAYMADVLPGVPCFVGIPDL